MEEIDFEYIVNNIWSKKIGIIIITLICVAAGWYYSYNMISPEYQAYTTLVLAKDNTVSSSESDYMQITQTELSINQKLISTYSALIKTKDVLEQVIQNLDISVTVDQLRKNISVNSVSGTELIKIIVTDKKPANAAKIANETAKVFEQKIAKEIYNINNIHIVEEAEPNKVPSNINHKKDLILALVVGLLISATYVFVATLLDTTLKKSEDIEKLTGLVVLGNIPKANLENKGGKRYE